MRGGVLACGSARIHVALRHLAWFPLAVLDPSPRLPGRSNDPQTVRPRAFGPFRGNDACERRLQGFTVPDELDQEFPVCGHRGIGRRFRLQRPRIPTARCDEGRILLGGRCSRCERRATGLGRVASSSCVPADHGPRLDVDPSRELQRAPTRRARAQILARRFDRLVFRTDSDSLATVSGDRRRSGRPAWTPRTGWAGRFQCCCQCGGRSG